MDIKVRSAKIGDMSSIQSLNCKLCKNEKKDYDSTIYSDYPYRKAAIKYLKKRIAKDGRASIATVDGKVVGYLIGAIVNAEPYRNISKMAEVETMFVDDGYRNMGIGAMLMKDFIKWCNSKKVQRVKVAASADNGRGIAFYGKYGFGKYALILEKKL